MSPPNVHTVYRQRGFAPHAEPSFRLGRFYFPRSRALSLPRPAGFENSKRQSDCLKLSPTLLPVCTYDRGAPSHDRYHPRRFFFFSISGALRSCSFSLRSAGRPCCFFASLFFFQSSHVGLYDTLTLHCMPRSRCVDDGLRNGARPHPAPHRGVELAINCTSHRQTIAHTNAAASAHPSHRCVYT